MIDDSVLRHRAEIILGLLATTLAASAALLVPGQSRQALGLELMPIALAYIALSSLATFRAIHSPHRDARALDPVRWPRDRAATRLKR